jgi:predicted DsbA family dithiol-disulfide isomerase
MMMEQPKIIIEIWSDIVCPFCYIGKRHLEMALESFEGKDEVKIIWKSFLLNPDLKTDTELTLYEYLSQSKGISMPQVKAMTERVLEMASAAGLQYRLDEAVVANSLNAHRLLHFAQENGKGTETKERLLSAYFCEAKNIDDTNVLKALAAELGLNKEESNDVISTERYKLEVLKDYQMASHFGISGVPFFVFNRKFAISGAQPVELFIQTFEKAASAAN